MCLERTESCPRGRRARSGHVFFCLSCFLGSPVAESDDEPEWPPTPAAAGSKRKLSAWLSNPALEKKKKKEKKTISVDAPPPPPLMAAAAAAAAAQRSKGTPASSAETRTDDSRRGDRDQHRARIKSKCSEPSSVSKNKNKVPTGSKTQKTSQDLARRSTHAPLAGLCVMMTALATMVFSGRAAAVIYLCSCLYMLQLARAQAITDDGAAMGKVDMDSNEYRKRVVLEGFLERNGRP